MSAPHPQVGSRIRETPQERAARAAIDGDEREHVGTLRDGPFTIGEECAEYWIARFDGASGDVYVWRDGFEVLPLEFQRSL